MSAEAFNDAELVGESLAGNRDAFGQIIARYQSLVCSLAYSATGSLSQSEDLAQETFVAARNNRPICELILFFCQLKQVGICPTVLLAQLLHLDFRGVVHAELKQGGVGVKLQVEFEFRRVECPPFAVEFLDGQGVERHGIAAEPKLIQHGGVVQQAARAAFVLADEGVGDGERDAVADCRQGVNFRHGNGEPSGVALEPQGIVHAAQGQAVKVSANAGVFPIEQRRDADDFGDLPADDFGNKGFSPDAFAFFPNSRSPQTRLPMMAVSG